MPDIFEKQGWMRGSVPRGINWGRTMTRIDPKFVVLSFAAIIGAIIVALSLLVFYSTFSLPADRFGLVKDAFDMVVSKVLLPLFTTIVTVSLTYIFGKQLVSAVSDRIRSSSDVRQNVTTKAQ